MKRLTVVSLSLVLGSIAFAAAPDSIVGFVYYDTGNYLGPQPRRRFEQFAATFARDGTYTEIFYQTNIGAGAPTQLEAPRNGSFTYRKIDDVIAELSLSGVQTGVLKFDSASAATGEFVDPRRDPNNLSGVVQRRFRLAPLSPASALVNCSNRSFVRPGGTAQTGFVISGAVWRFVLVRAVGPGLAAFGVSGLLRDPVLRIQGRGTNDDWGAENATSINRTSALTGAFPLGAASKDSAIIVEVPPIAHVAEVSSADPTDSGEVLIEVYLLP